MRIAGSPLFIKHVVLFFKTSPGVERDICFIKALSFCISLKLSDNAVSILGIIFRPVAFRKRLGGV